MTNYPSFIKGKLTKIIRKMAAEPKTFVKNPNVDFTRNRKLLLLLTLPDRTLVKFIVRKFISYCLTERFRASNMQ